MRIDYRKKFLKQFAKLQQWQQVAVKDAIEQFRINPHHPLLRNHALKGPLQGMHAISAGFDLRIIFEERDGYAVVLMLAVGTHEEVY